MNEHDEGAAEVAPTPNHSATVSFVDGKIRFWAGERLSSEVYQGVRREGFSWHRGEQCLIAKYSTWREDYLLKTFGVELEPEDNEERAALNAERAAERAERFGTYADNADKRSHAHYDRAGDMASIIPFGQPILVGHHSEQRDRNYRAKIWRQMDKSVEEGKKSDYWQHRAEAVLRRQQQKEDPGVIYRRIQGLEAELRDAERIKNVRYGTFLQHRLDYERALYRASGGIPADDQLGKLEVGGAVLGRWNGAKLILRINKGQDGKVKSVSVPSGYSWNSTIPIDRIRKVWTKAEVEAATENVEKPKTSQYIYEVGGAVESPYYAVGNGRWLEIKKVNPQTVVAGPNGTKFRKAGIGKPMSKAEYEAFKKAQEGAGGG